MPGEMVPAPNGFEIYDDVELVRPLP